MVRGAERGNRLSPIDRLPRVVDDALLHEVDDAGAQKLGVHAEVLLLREGREDGIGEAPVSHLNGVAVLHNSRDVVADPLRYLARHARLVGQERLVVVYDEVDVVDVHERVAVDARHLHRGATSG